MIFTVRNDGDQEVFGFRCFSLVNQYLLNYLKEILEIILINQSHLELDLNQMPSFNSISEKLIPNN